MSTTIYKMIAEHLNLSIGSHRGLGIRFSCQTKIFNLIVSWWTKSQNTVDKNPKAIRQNHKTQWTKSQLCIYELPTAFIKKINSKSKNYLYF